MKKSILFVAAIMVSMTIVACGNKTDRNPATSTSDTTSVTAPKSASTIEIKDQRKPALTGVATFLYHFN